MQSGYLIKDSVEKLENLSKLTCGVIFKRTSFSIFTQINYTLLIIFCIVCIMLNLFIQIPGDGSYMLKILEICLSVLITGEIAFRAFYKRDFNSWSYSISNLGDYSIAVLSFVGILLCFHQDYMEFLGDTACDILFILRSGLFITKIMFVCNYGHESKLINLSISLNDENEEDDFRRKFEQARLRYRYRATMPVLEEEDEEDEEEDRKCANEDEVLDRFQKLGNSKII
ncbi:hypothetical protein SteCoe_23380 [Stentor coeruleus]|uniref:Ion transport domain-containing protein n=1 Tax=Stentor coeruleus TaxID=5963 RepID=A0A1R2BK22_9CILI|nr:hypothetical protein SteCoe_23380 [Stentor coeruleus]